MSWRDSLIRISSYEVEVLQKRLGEIVGRREAAQRRLSALEVQAAAELARAADVRFPHTGYLAGVKLKREAIAREIGDIAAEETGARDALAEAFESQKKFEQVAANARLAEDQEAARREGAAMRHPARGPGRPGRGGAHGLRRARGPQRVSAPRAAGRCAQGRRTLSRRLCGELGTPAPSGLCRSPDPPVLPAHSRVGDEDGVHRPGRRQLSLRHSRRHRRVCGEPRHAALRHHPGLAPPASARL